MKIKLVAFFCLSLLHSLSAKSQKYDTVRVGLLTTVHIVFNSPVMNYDLGSGTRIENGAEVSDVIIGKVGDRLKLAAAIERFETTNLFVETENAYFNVILVYSDQPKQLTYYQGDDRADRVKDPGKKQKESLAKEESEMGKAKEEMILELTLKDLANDVLEKGNVVPDIGESSQRMKYFLNGIYVKGDYLFFRVNVLNEGNVKYDLGYEGFFITDKKNKGTKKTPTQPEPLKTLLILNDEIKSVEKKQEISKVYVFKKFTLEPKKVFTIEFWEDGQGQRKVELIIPPDKLLSAKTI
jgi:hypothetical protein